MQLLTFCVIFLVIICGLAMLYRASLFNPDAPGCVNPSILGIAMEQTQQSEQSDESIDSPASKSANVTTTSRAPASKGVATDDLQFMSISTTEMYTTGNGGNSGKHAHQPVAGGNSGENNGGGNNGSNGSNQMMENEPDSPETMLSDPDSPDSPDSHPAESNTESESLGSTGSRSSGPPAECALHQAPLDEIGLFIFHCLYVFILYTQNAIYPRDLSLSISPQMIIRYCFTVYVAVLIEHSRWTQHTPKSKTQTVYYRLTACCQSCRCRTPIQKSRAHHQWAAHIAVGGASPVMTPIGVVIDDQGTPQITQMAPTPKEEEDLNTDDILNHVSASVLRDALSESVTADSGHIEDMNPMDKIPDFLTDLEPMEDNATFNTLAPLEDAQTLTETQLQASLNQITAGGEVIGHRGSRKLLKSKIKKHHDAKSKVVTIAEEAALEKELRHPDRSLVHEGQSITVFSSQQLPRQSPNFGRQTTPGPADSFENASCTTIVFEFADCICPGAQVEKLKGKGPEWMKSQSQFQKEMFLGGSDRVNMLKKWLKFNVNRNRRIRFCLVSNEETKMMILLLQSLDLLRYFVSLNPNRPRKRKKSKAGHSGLLQLRKWKDVFKF